MSTESTSTGQGNSRSKELSVREAADSAGVSEATIRRRIKSGVIQNARLDADGTWRIFAGDLDAVHVAPRQTPAPAPRGRTLVNAELAQVRTELAVETARREAAEQLAGERAETITSLRNALNALEGPSLKSRSTSDTPAQEAKPRKDRSTTEAGDTKHKAGKPETGKKDKKSKKKDKAGVDKGSPKGDKKKHDGKKKGDKKKGDKK